VIEVNPDALAIADTLDGERKRNAVRGPLLRHPRSHQRQHRYVRPHDDHGGFARPARIEAAEGCDDRPAGDQTPAAVWFAYTPDRKGEHPQAHLSKFQGTLQADGYAGFEQIYEGGRIQEAACWAHVRTKFLRS
jgi:hypothetical protein